MISEQTIAEGLRALGLDTSSSVIVHSSLKSFGYVEGGAPAVCRALVAICGTVLMPAGSWDLTGVPAPPGLERPHNAARIAASWQEFDDALAHAVPFADSLPIDRELGHIPETLRNEFPIRRSRHPLFAFQATGLYAGELVDAGRLDWPLGPIEALAECGGDVLLLGVGHTSNTAIHLAEQRLGRSRFYRYAKVDDGVWAEFPNIPGCSDGFDAIEPELAAVTQETMIGACRARRIPLPEILKAAERLIHADPAALLCEGNSCRCEAALQQRLKWIEKGDPTADAYIA